MAIFKESYKVSIENINKETLISNLGMLRILEDIACSHSDQNGFGINDISRTHLSWFLLAWKVKILKRCPYASTLTVHTWASNSNKFQTYRDFEVYDENNELICRASSKWTLIDISKGNITRITDKIMTPYAPEPTHHTFENFEIDKLLEPTEFTSEYIYKTQRRDIDVNEHMHNLNYLSLAYEALPEEVYLSPECNNIEIMYKKGIKFGDTVKCLYSFMDNSHFVTMKSEDDKTLYAIVKLY